MRQDSIFENTVEVGVTELKVGGTGNLFIVHEEY